jgi:uncharacterized protein (DUF1330 family)
VKSQIANGKSERPRCGFGALLSFPVPETNPIPEYLAPYEEAVERYGASFESLLWHSEEFQGERFRIICEVAQVAERVIADLGCGRADLLQYLHTHNAGHARYLGVEAIDELAEFSRQRAAGAGWGEAEIIQADFVGDAGLMGRLVRDHGAEILVFSGSLNTLEPRQAAAVLDRAWDAVRHTPRGTLVFNFLSTHGRRMTTPMGPARRFNPTPLIKWALRRAPAMIVRHDYLSGHDATIMMSAR